MEPTGAAISQPTGKPRPKVQQASTKM